MERYLFQSARLGFRNWVEEDILPFAALCSDKRVMEFYPKQLTLQEATAFIERIKQHFSEKGYGLYAVDELSTRRFIGYIGFLTAQFPAWFTPCTEIGWRLSYAAWGRGLATEGALQCLAYGWTHFHFKEIYSFTAVINKRSERVMQKIGMHLAGSFDHPNVEEGSPLKKHVLYRIATDGQ